MFYPTNKKKTHPLLPFFFIFFRSSLLHSPSDLFELSEADQAALFQLAQDIAAVESEIELLKETTEGFQPTDLDHPSFSTPLGMEVIQTPAFSLGSRCVILLWLF